MTCTDDKLTVLHRAILENPEDDTARLVYADRLDELGESERAEFIRVQVQLAATADPHSDRFWDGQLGEGPEHYRHRKALRQRERELFQSPCIGRFLPQSLDASLTLSTSVFAADGGGAFALVSRGFVSEVRLTLAAFVGGECERCDVGPGVRRYPTHGGDWIEDECNHCSGTGHITGCAEALFRTQPCEKVVLVDREPADRTGVNEQWYWFRDHRNALGGWNDANHLPDALFDRLGCTTEEVIGLPFPDRQAALDALSAACVQYGRHLAKLTGGAN